MRLIFILCFIFVTGCQEKTVSTPVSGQVSSSVATDPFAPKDGDPGCADSELTEEKIVEKAMEKPKVDENSGALQGATDCEVQ